MRWGLLLFLGWVCAFGASAHPHNSLEIIEPPAPVFPQTPFPGRCDVSFDVEDWTRIMVKTVECSAPIFCASARDAVESSKLRVVDNKGEEGPGIVRNAVYPLTYLLGNSSESQIKWIESRRLFPCTADLVS